MGFFDSKLGARIWGGVERGTISPMKKGERERNTKGRGEPT